MTSASRLAPLCLALLVGCSTGSTPSEGVQGTRWGMGEEDARHVVGGAGPCAGEGYISPAGQRCGFRAPIELLSLRGDSSFYFRSGRLEMVLVAFRVGQAEAEPKRQFLASLLRKKYGPGIQPPSGDGGMTTWQTRDTEIRLELCGPTIGKEASQEHYALYLTYESRQAQHEAEERLMQKL